MKITAITIAFLISLPTVAQQTSKDTLYFNYDNNTLLLILRFRNTFI